MYIQWLKSFNQSLEYLIPVPSPSTSYRFLNGRPDGSPNLHVAGKMQRTATLFLETS